MLIVFDLDGTLIDSRRDLADATNALIEELGGRPLAVEDVAAMVGDGAAVLVRRAIAKSGLDPELLTSRNEDGARAALDRFLAHYDRRLTSHTRPYPGIPETVSALRSAGHTLAVLTNKPQRQTNEILERLGLAPAFTDVVGGDTAAGRKPHPGGLLQMMVRLSATAGSTVLVGDSPVDLETARNARTHICLARYGFGYRFTEDVFRGDEKFIDAPAEVAAIVSDLQSAGDGGHGGTGDAGQDQHGGTETRRVRNDSE
jgi:phosphoglycolate phosphatase